MYLRAKARLYCQISGGRVLQLAGIEELLEAATHRTQRIKRLGYMLIAQRAAGQPIYISQLCVRF